MQGSSSLQCRTEKGAKMCECVGKVCVYQTDLTSVWLGFDVWTHTRACTHLRVLARAHILQMIVFKEFKPGSSGGRSASWPRSREWSVASVHGDKKPGWYAQTAIFSHILPHTKKRLSSFLVAHTDAVTYHFFHTCPLFLFVPRSCASPPSTYFPFPCPLISTISKPSTSLYSFIFHSPLKHTHTSPLSSFQKTEAFHSDSLALLVSFFFPLLLLLSPHSFSY